MAEKTKIKVLIVDDTKIGGKHVDAGSIMEFDPEVAQDRTNYAMLKHAGRLADATDDNINRVKELVEAKKVAKAAARKQSGSASSAEAAPSAPTMRPSSAGSSVDPA